MITAASSGSGKTMITCGLLELFKRKGLNPLACKCGPDYIDGLFHKQVLELEGMNLDSYFEAPEELRDKYSRLSKGHLPVVEGPAPGRWLTYWIFRQCWWLMPEEPAYRWLQS